MGITEVTLLDDTDRQVFPTKISFAHISFRILSWVHPSDYINLRLTECKPMQLYVVLYDQED